MVTTVPGEPDVGLKEFIIVSDVKIKPGLLAIPPGVTTVTDPEAPDATTAVIVVALTTLNEAAAVPPKLTAVAPEKFIPVIVTTPPVPVLIGVKVVIVGGGI